MMEQMLDFLIPAAYADTAAIAQPGAQGSSMSFLMMFGILVFFYLFVWRPQSKRAKEQQTLLNSLTVEDEVIAAGGILGRIKKLDEQYIVLIIANGIELVVQRASVLRVLPKGTLKSIE